MKRAVWALAAGGMVVAACGGGGESTGTLTVKEVASATNDASSFRISGEMELRVLKVSSTLTGDFDAEGRVRLAFANPIFDLSEVISSGDRAYLRMPRSDGSGPREWCENEITDWEDGPNVSPVDTLRKLAREGQSLKRVGDELVRDATTVHYSVEGENAPTEIWVDGQDRLRRLMRTDDEQSVTIELFDFGVPIEITVPEGAPPCSAFTR